LRNLNLLLPGLASRLGEDSHAAAFRKRAEIAPVAIDHWGAGDVMSQKETNPSKDIVFRIYGDELRHHDLLGQS